MYKKRPSEHAHFQDTTWRGRPEYLYEKDLEIFFEMIEDGNLDEKEVMNEYCKVIDTVRFLLTSLFHLHQ